LIYKFLIWYIIRFIFVVSSDAKQNKGSILKASVDYIMHIKAQSDETKKIIDTNKYLLGLNKKLCYRIKVVEYVTFIKSSDLI
jgi:hypothetical protein